MLQGLSKSAVKLLLVRIRCSNCLFNRLELLYRYSKTRFVAICQYRKLILLVDDLNMTPLMWNCRYQNNLSILWTLLNLRASVNLQDDDGNTALHYAAMQNRLSAVRSLLSFGADYRGQNTNGMTPLACAKACNYSRLVQLLEAYQELEERKEHRVFRVGLPDAYLNRNLTTCSGAKKTHSGSCSFFPLYLFCWS